MVTGKQIGFLLPGEESVEVYPGEELGKAGGCHLVPETGEELEQQEAVLREGGGEGELANDKRVLMSCDQD